MLADRSTAAAASLPSTSIAGAGHAADAMDGLPVLPGHAPNERDVRADHTNDGGVRASSTTQSGCALSLDGCRASAARTPLSSIGPQHDSLQHEAALPVKSTAAAAAAGSELGAAVADVHATQPAAGGADVHATQPAAASDVHATQPAVVRSPEVRFEAVCAESEGDAPHESFAMLVQPDAQLMIGRLVPELPTQAADVPLPDVVGLSRRHAQLDLVSGRIHLTQLAPNSSPTFHNSATS
jgi:hypothetical protein